MDEIIAKPMHERRYIQAGYRITLGELQQHRFSYLELHVLTFSCVHNVLILHTFNSTVPVPRYF